jgi:c-di-GMP-binding flagellar brake protein YcgR
MPGTQNVREHRGDRILEDAITERRRVIVTHRGGQGWRTYKAVFASGSKSAGTLAVKVPSCLIPAADGSWHVEEVLGLTFRDGHAKCLFSATVLQTGRSADHHVVTLTWPGELQRLQRRVYQRVVPPKDTVIAVRFWRENESGGRDAAVRHGQLEDFSAGGMRIQAADALDVKLNAAYRCSFCPRPGVPAIVLDATLRHHQAAHQGRAALGFQFIGQEATPEGRRVLDRLARFVESIQRRRRRRTAVPCDGEAVEEEKPSSSASALSSD